MTPRICSVIATYDRYDTLPMAIDSLLRQSLPATEREVVVVDNSPDIAGALLWQRRYRATAGLRYIVRAEPGLSGARNAGAGLTRAGVVHCMDDDATADGRLLEELVDVFERTGAAIVGGRVRPAFTGPRPSWLHDRLLAYLSVIDWGAETRPLLPGEWLAGANLAFARDALEAAGLFSLNLGRRGAGEALLSNEETDLIGRITAAGGQAYYAPTAGIDHHIDARRLRRSWFRRRAAWQAASDFVRDQKAASARSGDAWNAVLDRLARFPARDRNLHGLAAATDDPGLFLQQVDAIYDLTIAALAGFAGAGDDG